MKSLQEYINEEYNRLKDPNYVIKGFSIGDIKNKIDQEYGCDLEVEVYDDVVMFYDNETNINFSIELVQKKIVCSDGIKQCLMELGYEEKHFE